MPEDKNCESSGERPECIGEICWLEIPVMDIVRAQKFYTDIFGWNCNSQVVRPSDGNVPAGEDCPVKSIHFFNKGQTLNGAFQLMRDDNHFANVDLDRPHAIPVLPTLNVKDCAKTLEQVEQAGGRTQWPKTHIGNNMGFYARLIDTEGNMIGIWSYV